MSAGNSWKLGSERPRGKTKAKCQIVVVSVHFSTKRADSPTMKGARPGILSGTYYASFVESSLRVGFWGLHEFVQFQQEFDRGGFYFGRDRNSARDHRAALGRRAQ